MSAASTQAPGQTMQTRIGTRRPFMVHSALPSSASKPAPTNTHQITTIPVPSAPNHSTNFLTSNFPRPLYHLTNTQQTTPISTQSQLNHSTTFLTCNNPYTIFPTRTYAYTPFLTRTLPFCHLPNQRITPTLSSQPTQKKYITFPTGTKPLLILNQVSPSSAYHTTLHQTKRLHYLPNQHLPVYHLPKSDLSPMPPSQPATNTYIIFLYSHNPTYITYPAGTIPLLVLNLHFSPQPAFQPALHHESPSQPAPSP